MADVAKIAAEIVRGSGIWMIATQTQPDKPFGKDWWHVITPSSNAFVRAWEIGLIKRSGSNKDGAKYVLTTLGLAVRAHLSADQSNISQETQ